MRWRSTILPASLAANVLLAAILFRQPSASQPVGSVTAAANDPVSHRSQPKPAPATEAGPSAAGNEAAAGAEPGFHWSQLEAADYKEYIARLRAFGVPERTIRDLITADVDKLYRPRLAALRPKKVTNTNFWENRNWYQPHANQTKEQRQQTAALQKEQKELLKTLLGDDVYEQTAKDSGWPESTDPFFGSLSKEQRDKVGEIQERFQEASAEIYAKAEGYFDQDMQAELNVLKRKLHDELKAVMTPEQLEDYEVRRSDVANNMRWQLGGFDPSEQEFRAIFRHKQAAEETDPRPSPDGERPSAEEMKARRDQQKEMEDALAQMLGPERMKEYKMMEGEFRNLFESGVPKDTIFKVADMKQQTEEATRKLRQDRTLTAEQRKEALLAIRATAEQELASLLGERRAKAYASQGGYWIRNIARRANDL